MVALLFLTAASAQRGMRGFGGNPGLRGPGAYGGHGHAIGGGFRGGLGFRTPGPMGRGFIGSHYGRGGFGYGRSVRSVYRGGWGSGLGAIYPVGWYSAPLWTSPAVYHGWNPYGYNTGYGDSTGYPYNSGPSITIITVPTPTTQPSSAVVDLNRTQAYSLPAPEPTPEKAANRPLVSESWAYLIATRDDKIWLARQFRVEGGLLHFATMDEKWKTVPLANVDSFLTEQLNRERGIAVDLR